MKREEWRAVVGYEGRYMVSSEGRIKSLPNQRRNSELLMKQSGHCRSGHMVVNLTTKNSDGRWRQKVEYVHQLVLKSFIGDCEDGMEACHGDGNPENNNLKNLRWDSRKMNQLDRVSHGTANRGERNGRAKISEIIVKAIKTKLASGLKQTQIAKEFCISRSAVSGIATGRLWRNV